jgi:hypothetical protein
MRTFWSLLAVAALLSLTVVAFADPLDNGDPGELEDPDVTYTNIYGDPYDCSGAVYDYDDYAWILGSEDGSSDFSVKCDVEMWLNMHLDAHDIYFHKADGTTSMSATVAGWLESNNGQYLFVAVPTEQQSKGEPFLQNLVFTEDGFGRETVSSGDGSDIPMTWELRDDDAGGGWRSWATGTYSTAGNAGQLHGYSWLLASGNAGLINYQIRTSISPAKYQADGEYRMDPVIAVAPAL